MQLLEVHVKRIRQSFELGNHAVAWGFINSCIDEWDHEDWMFVVNYVPLEHNIIVKYVRHYRMFLHHIQKYVSGISHNHNIHGILRPIWVQIDKVITKERKWAEQQYAMKCLTLAC